MSTSTTKFYHTLVLAFAVLVSAASAADLPAPLDRVLMEAERQADTRVSFTLKFEAVGEPILVERFDAITGTWTALEGSRKALSRAARQAYRKYCRYESAPGGLVYADYRESFGEVTVRAETSEKIIYDFQPPNIPADVLKQKDILTAQLIIDKPGNALTLFETTAAAPFRANAVTRFDEFIFVQKFERVLDNIPPLMTEFRYRAKGRKAMSEMNDDFTMRFYDFAVVE